MKPSIVETGVGRRQAFALVSGRCPACDAEILFEIREKKLFRKMEQSWADSCSDRLGLTRSYVDRVIRQSLELGPNWARLNSFTQPRADLVALHLHVGPVNPPNTSARLRRR